MNIVHELFKSQPLLALFITIALGYLVGKIKIGSFVLGGIAGTLLVGVVIGQLGIDIDSGIKNIFFALFIYAVGFQGGPQFFHALNVRSLNQLASSFVMCFVGLLCVLAAAWMFGLDRGMAAGLQNATCVFAQVNTQQPRGSLKCVLPDLAVRRVDHFCELRARARRSRGRRRPIFFLRIRLAAQRECSAAAPSAASYGVDVAAGGLHRQADGPR